MYIQEDDKEWIIIRKTKNNKALLITSETDYTKVLGLLQFAILIASQTYMMGDSLDYDDSEDDEPNNDEVFED